MLNLRVGVDNVFDPFREVAQQHLGVWLAVRQPEVRGYFKRALPSMSVDTVALTTFEIIWPSCAECVSNMMTILASGLSCRNLSSATIAFDFALLWMPSLTGTMSSCEIGQSLAPDLVHQSTH